MVGSIFAQLDITRAMVYHLKLRSQTEQSRVWYGNSLTNVTGYLDPGEATSFDNTSPSDIWVKGTPGDLVFWDGDGSQLQEYAS